MTTNAQCARHPRAARNVIAATFLAVLAVTTATPRGMAPRVFGAEPTPVTVEAVERDGQIVLRPKVGDAAPALVRWREAKQVEGGFWATVVWIDADGLPDARRVFVAMPLGREGQPGPGPAPKPSPGPGPAPAPKPAPTPGKLHVLILYEQDQVPRWPPAQARLLTSSAVRNYLAAHCADEQGTPAYRIWDQHVDASNEAKDWQDVFARAKSSAKSLPWIVVATAAESFEGPLPADEGALIELLKKYGGP